MEAEAAGDAVNLCAAEVEAVVVELLAEPEPVRAALVEGEVDNRALRPQRAHRGVEAGGVGAGLEHDVRAAIVATVILLGIYVLVAYAAQAYNGPQELIDNQEDVLSALAPRCSARRWTRS